VCVCVVCVCVCVSVLAVSHGDKHTHNGNPADQEPDPAECCNRPTLESRWASLHFAWGFRFGVLLLLFHLVISWSRS
jgi:hypothetical protein